jgi:predicted 3-demethylubiquinone-9 3-methyltransferase (glyoxalase superfamily)
VKNVQRIIPTIMFNSGAKAPVDFYLTVFQDSSLVREEFWPNGEHLASTFILNGLEYLAISGGPECAFTMASTFMINCDTQEEIDHYWNSLSEGGETHACGWLTDKFGVTWQVQPAWFGEKMATGTPAQSKAMFDSLMGMVKVNVEELLRAWNEA